MKKLCLALLLACACGADAAFDIELVPNPNLASPEQLGARIGTLVYVADSPEGLYAPGAESSDEQFQVKNADSNPADLELVATVPVRDTTLPIVRIEQGGLRDVAVDVLVLGLPLAGEGTPLAQGHVRGLRFTDEPIAVTISFDPRNDALPPRVQDVLPPDGSDLPGCRVPSVAIVFTRPVSEASLLADGAVRIEPPAGALTVSLDEAGIVATVIPEHLEADASELSYRVIVEPTVLDLVGQGFDQVPRVEGAQRYEAEFRQTCSPPPQLPEMPCGAIFCPPSQRIECVAERCTLVACSSPCPHGTVCDPVADRCPEDCRHDDAIADCAAGTACDETSGLCVAD